MRFSPILLVLAFSTSVQGQSEVEGVVAGVVFDDADGDGRRGPGEPGVGDALVCTRAGCARTDSEGTYEAPVVPGSAIVWVSLPEDQRAPAGFWRRIPADPFEWLVNIPLAEAEPVTSFRFLHASDTHLDEESLPRFRTMREIAESRGVQFVIITGDLIRDALRVSPETATERYRLLRKEVDAFSVPVWLAPGNHENFGIERHLSGVSEDHPLYAKGMYRRFMGPSYYSFDFGGVHFVALDTVDIDDRWYYGHVDAEQLAWLERDLAHVPAGRPIVTFNHIPLFSALVSAWGYYPPGDGDAPGTVIEVDGKPSFRHVVSNAQDVLQKFQGHNLTLALAGHIHAREEMVFGDARFQTRFHQTAAVVGPTGDDYGMELVSGVTLYTVQDGVVDDGEFIPLDAETTASSH